MAHILSQILKQFHIRMGPIVAYMYYYINDIPTCPCGRATVCASWWSSL